YPSHPPEMVYPRTAGTGEPAVVISGRVIYFPGDIERTMWHTDNPDLDQLLQNAIRQVAGPPSVRVEGDGIVELFAWETEPGWAVHLLNYTNPNMMAGWVRKIYP